VSPRYSVYFAPERGSPWWNFGSDWLGRDECSNLPLAQANISGISSAELFALTEEPRRYGFHATLKAPFRLNENFELNDLMISLGTLAKQNSPIELGTICAVKMGHFVALVPHMVNVSLISLAEKCVTELDHLRAPLTALEMARRQIETLDARGQYLLTKYGYPHVLDKFNFHFTLSGRISPLMADCIMNTVMEPLKHLNQTSPLVLDRLCLFIEDSPGQPFRRVADMGLGE
jgi:putative phosphonate metabolism protein